MNLLVTLLFICLSSSAWAQSQTFSNYVSGLAAAGTPTTTDSLYMLQGGNSRQVLANSLLGVRVYPVDRYGAIGNGTTDDAAAFTAALAACSTGGGGWVVLSPKRYLVDSATLTVPPACVLMCPEPAQVGGANSNFTAIPFTIILNSSRTITLSRSSGFIGCNLLQKAVASTYPTTLRAAYQLVAAFAGSGIVIAGGDTTIRDAFIGGFACGVIVTGDTCGSPTAAGSGSARMYMDHVNIDATQCVWVDGSHDNSQLNYVHCHPFMTASGVPQTATFTFTAVANNGAGLYRVTCSATCADPTNVATNTIRTGDTIWLTNAGTLVGVKSAQNRWVATAVDTTHVDLQGSTAASLAGVARTGDTFNGDPVVKNLSSLAGVGVGDTITGTGIPGGTTIVAIWPGYNAVVLSANATGTNTGATYTITDAAYSSGGTLRMESTYRSGDAFYFSVSEGILCQMCVEFGHLTSFHFGDAMYTFDCMGCWVDNAGTDDPNTVAILIDGATVTQGIKFIGGTLINKAEIVRGSGPNGGAANSLNGTTFATNHADRTVIELNDSSWQLLGVAHPTVTTHYIGIGPGVDKSNIVGINVYPDVIVYVNGADTKVTTAGNQLGP